MRGIRGWILGLCIREEGGVGWDEIDNTNHAYMIATDVG
jgi:hypothetical protein